MGEAIGQSTGTMGKPFREEGLVTEILGIDKHHTATGDSGRR